MLQFFGFLVKNMKNAYTGSDAFVDVIGQLANCRYIGRDIVGVWRYGHMRCG
ncbi:MAG: hypothetical protein ACK4UR_05680 [Caldimicrobium sp.]